MPYVKDEGFLVVYGDVLFADEAVKPLVEQVSQSNQCTALVKPAQTGRTLEWLCANVKENTLSQILGHPREATHLLCGVYWLPKSFIPFLEQNPGLMVAVEVGNMPPKEAELAQSLSQYLENGNTVKAVEVQGIFADLDKPWHYLDANTELLIYNGKKLKSNQLAEGAKIADGAEIEGYVVLDENAYIGHDAKIKGNLWVGKNSKVIDGPIIGDNSSIGDNTIVREYAYLEPWTSVGHNCVVGHCSEFGGIVMDRAYAFHYGEFWGIIGRACDLGAATVCGNLRFDDQNTIHRIKGRREQPASGSANAVYLGDYTRTGVNCILMPGVKVGAYSVIGAGVVLQEDVPNNTLLYLKQELERRPWGPERYGW